MRLRNAHTAILALVVSIMLYACSSSSFSINNPKDGDIFLPPATTRVVVIASPSMSGLLVKLDGTDVSNQINYVSDSRSEGNLSLTEGKHRISAEAYVKNTQLSSITNVCVIPETSLNTPSKTAFTVGSNDSWNRADYAPRLVRVDPDDGTLKTRWNLIRLGGIASSTGLIQSIENECLCMRSMDDKQGSIIGLALCDGTDALQQWQALQIPPGNGNFRFQNNGRGVSDACLTEDPAGSAALIQLSCNDRPNQLWKVRDNTTGQFLTESPW